VLALRLTRVAHPAVQLRRLTVAAASAGTGFLLLCSLAYALRHPDGSDAALLRLTWCAVPLAATVYLAVAVARADPGTRPRSALSALGLGPGRLMAVSAATTALSCAFGSLLGLLLFLHLRGNLTNLPFDGAASGLLAGKQRLPMPGTLILPAVVPALASAAVAWVLRPREHRPTARPVGRRTHAPTGTATGPEPGGVTREGAGAAGVSGLEQPGGTDGASAGLPRHEEPGAGSTSAGHATAGLVRLAQAGAGDAGAPGIATRVAPSAGDGGPQAAAGHAMPDPYRPLPPHRPPTGLPWGTAILAAGLSVEAYAGRVPGTPSATLPGGLAADSVPVLVGWLLTALGLAYAGPGLTHLTGRLLQSVRPGAVRLLAGRVLMEEASRIGRPLGVVCAVGSGVYAMFVLYGGAAPALGPLTVLGAALVAGCAVATLCTAAVGARQDRSGTIAALRRLGAPGTLLRTTAVLRTGALLALFAPLTLVIAYLAALPLAR
jgi:hypothetical protein